jgi:hypothetical protein
MAFKPQDNPLKGVRVQIPKEPLLMSALNKMKSEVGIGPTQMDSRKVESIEKRQKREDQYNNF